VKKRILIIAGVLAAALLAAGIYGWREYHRQHEDTADISAAFTVPAPTLMKAFQDNEDKANKQYNDKVVDIRGTVVKIEHNDSTQTVLLDGQSAMGGVICQFEPSHKDELASLRPGQPVTIRGVCTGVLMDVVLVRCAVSKH
jgi:hypothetical protein